jgi:single-stranded DNA-binding protein
LIEARFIPWFRARAGAWAGGGVEEPKAVATSGSAVANFTVASTPRTFDRQTNEWKDGETLFLRASVWREAAENVAESLTKGMALSSPAG